MERAGKQVRGPDGGRAGRRIVFALGVVFFGACLFALLTAEKAPTPSTPLPEAPVRPRHDAPLLDPGQVRSIPATAPASRPVEPGPAKHRAAGVVLDAETERGVEGASVFLAAPEEAAVSSDRAVRTGPDGRFDVSLATGESVAVHVAANGYVTWRGELFAGVPTKALEIRLTRGASLAGQVLDDLGAPLPDVRVSAVPEANRIAWPHSEMSFETDESGAGGWAISDTDGRFTIRGLVATTEYEIRATRYLWYQGPLLPPLVRPDPVTPVTVTLRPVARVRIFASDAKTHRPVDLVGMRGFLDGAVVAGQYSRSREARQQGVPAGLDERIAPGAPVIYEYMRDAVKLAKDPKPPAVQFQIMSAGYKPVWLTVPLEFGRVQDLRAELEPVAQETRPVRFTAASPTGVPYEGLLFVQVRAPSLNEPWGPEALFRFTAGRADRPIPLPVGKVNVGAVGGGHSARWLVGGNGPRAFDAIVDPGEDEQEIRIVLEATPVALEVSDARGRRLHGFDLSVSRTGALEEVLWWDVPWADEIDRRDTANGPLPVVWVPKGSVTLDVNMPKVGRGRAVVEATGDGTLQRAQIKLDPKLARDPREEERRALQLQGRLGPRK